MRERIFAIRGAIAPVENSVASITEKATGLFEKMLVENDLHRSRIVSVVISSTQDLTAYYPATAIRKRGLVDAPLMSCAEPAIDGAMSGCIRILITAAFRERKPNIKHIYLGDAVKLRPDIVQKENEE